MLRGQHCSYVAEPAPTSTACASIVMVVDLVLFQQPTESQLNLLEDEHSVERPTLMQFSSNSKHVGNAMCAQQSCYMITDVEPHAIHES